MISFKSKQPNVGTTIFTKMSALATEEGALNLSQGFPGFDCDPFLQDLLAHYAKGHNQYAPMAGIPELRVSIAEKTKKVYDIQLSPLTEITVVSGATEALFAAIHCCVHPGDEVILFDPSYDAYDPIVRLAGGVPIHLTLKAENAFRIDFEELEKTISPKTKAIVVNTPHNPTGSIWEMEDLDALARILKGTSILLVSDEVYEHIVFDGKKHASVLLHPELQKRSFVCGSFGKTYHITGWKMGYCLAPEYLTSEFRKMHQWVTFSSATPLQWALTDMLKHPNYWEDLSQFYQKKRDLFANALKSSRFKLLPSEGSFFQCVDYTSITNEFDQDLAIRLTKEIKVASIPISVFYENAPNQHILRFCFAKTDEMLLEAANRLSQL
ncbi:MAG: Methionine aminotransferase [Bacteroidota bacterium]|jgi:methionine aminotransferase